MLRSFIEKRWHQMVLVGLLAAGIVVTADALWLAGKAQLAQVLLSRAWAATLEDGTDQKPWPWADHWPVARLMVPDLSVNQIVLAGDSGAALAFAPGQNALAGKPGEGSAVVFSGHRDTHFRFLKEMAIGMEIDVQTRSQSIRYRVREVSIVDTRKFRIATGGQVELLLLVTCYPFDSLRAGGPLRYVVTAERDAQPVNG